MKIVEISSETSTIAVDCREECSQVAKKQTKVECKDIFLSHSGFQKSFADQLHRDLQREQMSSFLDKDPQSLPKGEPFPPCILSNARNCKVAVLVLSPQFLFSKWPMLELVEIVKARKFSNPNMVILPLFYKISLKTLKEQIKKGVLLPKWKQLQEEDERINCEECEKALKKICKFNGMEYAEGETDGVYRDQIIEQIHVLLPPNLKYDDSHVQGKTRLCQEEVAKLYEKAQWRNGVKVVGLYEIAGSGKTTISMSLCNFYSRKFKGKVFLAEFGKESFLETQKQVLKALTYASDKLLSSVTSEKLGSELLRKRMPEHEVFMAMDNISDTTESIEAAKLYMDAGFKEGSMLLLTARSAAVLKRILMEEEILLSRVPFLEGENAMAILLKLTPVKLSDLTRAEREVATDCINKCRFGGTYHPLAIQAFGAYLFDRFGPRLLQWNEIPDFRDTTGSEVEKVFRVFELSLKDLNPRWVDVFMFVALYLPDGENLEHALGWLAVVCNESIDCVVVIVKDLKKLGLIEEVGSELRVHDLICDFAESRANGTWISWWCFRGEEEVFRRFEQTLLCDKFCLQKIKFTNCSLPLLWYNFELLANVIVLHFESVCQLRSLDLRPLKKLRSLVIRDCREFEEIMGIEHLSNIAWIQVDGYNSLTRAPQIEGIRSLRGFHWECRGIEKSRELASASVETPTTTTRLGDLRNSISLESIEIHCQSLEEFPMLEALPNLRNIYFAGCPLVTTGPNLSRCSKLRGAYFDGCSAMTTGPNLSGCSQFYEASFQGCSAMTTGPELRGCSQLQYAYFHGCSAMTTGPDFSGCSQLRGAFFEECSAMTTGPILSGCTQLYEASFQGCSSMTTGPDLSGCSQLRGAYFEGCSAMATGPDLSGCSQLRGAYFHGCCAITTGPHLSGCSAMITGPHLSGCSQLGYAYFHGCSAMTTGPDLRECSQLEYAHFHGCSAMTIGPDLSGCLQLYDASFQGCSAMSIAPNLSGCSQLQCVDFSRCSAMTASPDLSGCSQLQYADFSRCSAMATSPDLRGCSQLQHADFKGCCAMTTGPDLSGCSQLQYADFKGCCAMTTGPEVGACIRLSFLRLEGLEGLINFNRLTALRRLELIDCGIDEAIDITTCREVEDLTATKCRGGFTGLFLSVAHLSSLRSFTLRHCEGVVHPPDLTNCRHLENVEIRGCSGLTRFPNFAGLSALKRLVLRECHAVDEAPDLSGCKGLQEIELRDNLKMERLPWMLDCTSLSRLDLSWGIAVDTDRTPQQLRTCPIFRHRHSLTKHFGLHSLGNKYYRTAEIRMKQTELH